MAREGTFIFQLLVFKGYPTPEISKKSSNPIPPKNSGEFQPSKWQVQLARTVLKKTLWGTWDGNIYSAFLRRVWIPSNGNKQDLGHL